MLLFSHNSTSNQRRQSVNICFTLRFPHHLPRPLYSGDQIGVIWKHFDWVVPRIDEEVNFGRIAGYVKRVSHNVCGSSGCVDVTLSPSTRWDPIEEISKTSKAISFLIDEESWMFN
jgi:hypothetical protein